MLTIKYYFSSKANDDISKLLAAVMARHSVPYEMVDLSNNGAYNQEKEKIVYENDFKPRAKILRARTGVPITRLRSRKARNYFVSTPGTLAIFGNTGIEWYTLGNDDIARFLTEVLKRGHPAIEERFGRGLG